MVRVVTCEIHPEKGGPGLFSAILWANHGFLTKWKQPSNMLLLAWLISSTRWDPRHEREMGTSLLRHKHNIIIIYDQDPKRWDFLAWRLLKPLTPGIKHFQLGQTKLTHPVLTGSHPVIAWGLTPSNVPNLPQVVRVHCTCNNPSCRLVIGCHRFQVADWSACGVVAGTMHPNHPG